MMQIADFNIRKSLQLCCKSPRERREGVIMNGDCQMRGMKEVGNEQKSQGGFQVFPSKDDGARKL